MTERKAPHGEKEIQIKVRLRTNGLAKGASKILQKHTWSSGTVGLPVNKAHGIKATREIPFNSLLELSAKIEELLRRENITVHLDHNMHEYIRPRPK